MTTQRHRWTIGAVAVSAAALVAAGLTVGTAGAAPSAPGATHRAGDSAGTPVSTASFSFQATVSGLTASPVSLSGQGQTDLADDSAAVTVDLPAAVVQLLPGGSEAAETVHAVLSAGTLYLEVPSLAGLVGQPWISVALPSTAAAALPGIFTKAASVLGDVNAIVTYALKHHATVSSLGPSTVDGVAATGTQIVDTAAQGGSALTASLWADQADQLVQATVAVTATTRKGPAAVNATIDFSRYDSPVTIVVPPSSEVKAVPYATVARILGPLFRHRSGRRLRSQGTRAT
jgi:hypothetical protein